MPDAKAKFRIEGEDATAAAFKSATKNAQEASEKMAGYFEAAFSGISVAAVVELGKHAIELGDSLDKARIKAGLSGKAISELSYAAKLSDVDLSALSTSLKFMQTNLSKAEQGSRDQTVALGALGLTFKQLKALAPDQQFTLLADRISKLKDPSDRARAAVEFFGKAGADLLPLFEQGAEGIRKAREEAEKLGYSFSDDQLSRLAKANDAWKTLKASFEALALTLTAKVAPALSKTFDEATRVLNGSWTDKYLALLKAGALTNPVTAPFAAGAIAAGSAAREKPLNIHGGLINRFSTVEEPPGFAGAEAAQKAAEENAKFNKQFLAEMSREEGAVYEQLGKDTREQMNLDFQRIDQLRKGTNDQKEVEYELFKQRQEQADKTFQLIETARDGLKAAFDDLIEHGQFSFRKLGQFILAELMRKDIYKAIDNLSDALENAFAKGRGSGLVGSFLGSLFGGSSSLSSVGSGAYANSAVFDSVPKYATGGSFMVGGRGGIDQNLVAFRASRGERVTISPQGRGTGAAGGVVVHNYVDNRGATSDFIGAFPELMKRNNEALIQTIVSGFQKKKWPLPAR